MKATTYDVNELLEAITKGDESAASVLMPVVYDELHSIARHYMRRETQGHTLDATDLVHEAYLKLVDQTRVDWQGRTHFFAVGATIMRRILGEHARRKHRLKRGGGMTRVSLEKGQPLTLAKDEDILAVEEVLEKLEVLDPRQAKIVELRFYGGLTMKEIAKALGVSLRTVEGEWSMVRAWLKREFSSPQEPPS